MTITVIPRRRNIEWLSKNIEKHMSLKIPQKDSQHSGPCFDFFCVVTTRVIKSGIQKHPKIAQEIRNIFQSNGPQQKCK